MPLRAARTVAGFSQHTSAVGELVRSLYALGAQARERTGADPGADSTPGVGPLAPLFGWLDRAGLTHVVSVDGLQAFVQADCTIRHLLAVLRGRGLAPLTIPTPTSRMIGQAIALGAADAGLVASLDLLTESGLIVTVQPEGPTADLFEATVGGCGATGFIVAARIRLISTGATRA